MALTGIQIFKLLPNTNCKECGFATCLAFAMRVAAKKIDAEACPYLSEEAKKVLGASAVPPINLLEISRGEESVKVGEELVMFRHEKKFYHKTAFAFCVKDTNDEKSTLEKLNWIKQINFERAGETLKFDLIAIKSNTNDKEKFKATVTVIRNNINFPFILLSDNPEIMREGLEVLKGAKPLMYLAHEDNWEKMSELAKTYNASLVISGKGGLESLAMLSEKVKSKGIENIVLNPESKPLSQMVNDYTMIRRLALEKNYRTFGHPTIAYIDGENAFPQSVIGICKYASILIFDDLKEWESLPLLTLRQNIFTDPQKPLQVDPGIYKIGEPDTNSPVFVTTNFSLTYFIVSTEIESGGYSAHLIVADADGLSVMTAWAAGKFSGESAGKSVKNSGIESRVSHRNIIIPGLAAAISGELEDALPGWKVLVGPQEASDIPTYLKEVLSEK